MSSENRSTVGIISNVYPIDVNIDIDTNFIRQIHDSKALYMLRNDDNISLRENEYKFTEEQQNEYDNYAVKCSYTEPNDNPYGVLNNGKVVCRCINTECAQFKKCRKSEPFSYQEIITRFGFKMNRSLINVELFEKYFNSFTEEELLALAKELKIKLIPGFTSIEKAISANRLFAKNFIKKDLKKSKASQYKTIEDYRVLKSKNETNYKIILLIDLFNDQNTSIIEELLKEEGSGAYDKAQSCNNEFIEELEKRNKILIEENNNLKKENTEIRKELKDVERSVQKKCEEEYREKLKKKISENNAKYQNEIEKLKKEISDNNDRYQEKLIELEKTISRNEVEYQEQNNICKAKERVYENILKDRKILLLMLKPVKIDLFPIQYRNISLDDILISKFPVENYEEVWIPAYMFNNIKLRTIKNIINQNTKCKIKEITEIEIIDMGLEVLS